MRARWLVRLVALGLLAVSAGSLAACNTTAGLGEDMSSAGHHLTHSAVRNK